MGPLTGVRVLDLSQVVAGPFCTMILGDLGADVIKIEPPEGDVSRRVFAAERGGVSVGILNWNRNKRAMVLDLKRAGAAEVFLKLAENADVVVQNFRPGVVDRLGVGYQAVAARNLQIVYCSIVGYGFTGPYRDRPAYDPIIQGMAGVMATQYSDGRPRAVKHIIGDKVTAMTAAIAILAALHQAQSGKGQNLELAMIDAVAYYLMGDKAAHHTFLPHKRGVPPTVSSLEPFRTADGWITVAPLTDQDWSALVTAVGRPDLLAGDIPRAERGRRVLKTLSELFPSESSAYWLERIQQADVPCGPVNDFDTIWEDPQFIANRTFFEYEHPRAGRVRAVRTPAHFSASQTGLWRQAPELGQQTDRILKDFGFSAGEIAHLHADGIVR